MEMLLKAIHAANDHERELFGAARKPFNSSLVRWHSDLRPDQANNNFFYPVGPIAAEDLAKAEAFQKERGLDYLLLRTGEPLPESLRREFEEEVLYVMALTQDTSTNWKTNPAVEIRDIQSEDISADLLDVSGVPEEYRDLARRNMELVLEVAEKNPNYHWYCAYLDGVHAANVYALCHGGCVEVDDLWVEEDYRHQYVATTLMKHIADTLDGTLYLHADASKTPKDMYARMGFSVVETVYEYYKEL